MAVRVRVNDLTKRYGDTPALDRVSIEVEPGELFFLIGPSGCGKTTLLRAIAGFVEPDAGTIRFDDRLMNAIRPHERNTVLVFQGYALWPHMTVAQNVEYGLRVRKLPSAERRRRIAEILDVVHLSEFADRYPSELSGGQQQRVALARAIVVSPDVLLMDEPLSNLDALLRIEMRREILRIHRQTGITTIYVTHDQKEALSMGQRIAILDRGRIVQIGRPEECYRRPRTRFVAHFLGEANSVEGAIAAVSSDGTCQVTTALGRLTVSPPAGKQTGEPPALHPAVGQSVGCCFRPESVRLVGSGASEAINRFRARVVSRTYLGETFELDLSAADGSLTLRATVIGNGEPAVEGSAIEFAIAPEDIVLL
jgi:iron(III) transport system ATP-binding protein